MSNTYHSLAGGLLEQNWSNPFLITIDDDWSGVPSIEGFLGQDITTATGTDPQTLLTDSAVGSDLDVIANQTNPDIVATGGVAEFDGITNLTVALNGSGTADAPHLIVYLDTTGMQNVRVRYDARDLDGSTDNAVEPLALQYRVGDSGLWTNVPAAFIADATTGPSQATLVTSVDVTLPAAVNNQPKVQLRIITANAAGNDEWIGIDNIVVSASLTTPPVIQNDQINAVQDTTLVVDAAHGVLANDSGAVAVVPGYYRTAAGGQISFGFNPDGSYSYVSAPGFSGTDSVQYTALDNNNNVAGIGTLTFNVAATAPLPFVSIGTQLGERHQVTAGFGQVGNGVATTASTPVPLSGGGYVVIVGYQDIALGSTIDVRTYDADHNLVGLFDPGFLVFSPRVTALPNGGYVLAYGVRDAAFGTLTNSVQLFDAAGHSLTAPAPFNVPGSFDGISGLSALPNGGFVLLQQPGTSSGSNTQLYAQSFSASGVPESQQYAIGSPDQTRGPIVLPNGEIVVSRIVNDNEVHLQRFDVHGNPIGGEILPTSDGRDVTGIRMVVRPDGGFVVSWMTMINPNGGPSGRNPVEQAHLQIVDADAHLVGTPATTDLTFSTLFGEPLSTSSVTPLANGGFVVRWRGIIDGTILDRAQAYDANGHAVGGPKDFVSQTPFGTTRPLVYALPDGGFAIGLQSANPANHNLLIYDNDGNAVGEVRMHDVADGTGASSFVLANRPNGDSLILSQAFGSTNATDDITIQTIRFDGATPVIQANQTGGTAKFSAAILPVRIYIPDPDGSEIVQSIDVSGVPAGWTLSHPSATATLNAGVWTVTGPGIAHGGAIDLHLAAPFGTTGSGTLSVVAHTIDTDNGSSNQSFPASFDFAHLPVNKLVPFDFDGDGTSDMLWRHSNGSVSEWQMKDGVIVGILGVGVLAPQWQFQDAGDFNGDTREDVLWRHASGQVVIWSLDGNQIVGNQNVASPGNDWHQNGTGDFDGDGRSDILWRHDSGQVVLWTMDGATITSNKSVGTLQNDFLVQSVSDFDGDGKSDVLLRSTSGQVVIWTMDGSQIVGNELVATPATAWHVLGTGDFDGDGKDDILWRHDSGQVVLWEMDGANIASNQSVATPGNDWHVQDVSDYNADGRSDVLWRNDNGQVAVWEMNGNQIVANHEVSSQGQPAKIGLEWTVQNHHYDLL